MQNLIFKGVATALVTPFLPTGEINFTALENLIESQIDGGCDALLVGGTTGESAALSDEEKSAIASFAAKIIRKRVPLIAGAGSNYTAKAAKNCAEMEKAGADALLLVTPYYNKCTKKGLIAHYKECAKASALPFILYNVPQRTGVNILPETYEDLLKIPNVKAVKEASGDVRQASRIRNLYKDDLALYCGCDELMPSMLAIGASGAISVLSNICPRGVHDICARYFSGDSEKSLELHNAYSKLTEALFREVNPVPVKAALNILKKDAGGLRLPLTEADKETKNILKKEIALLQCAGLCQ